MDQITLRLPEEVIEEIETEAREADVSRSEYLRDVIATRHESDELRSQCDELQTKCDRLEREKQLVLEQREEHTDLVRYVEDEMSYRDAGLATRAKWFLFGRERGR